MGKHAVFAGPDDKNVLAAVHANSGDCLFVVRTGSVVAAG